MKRLNLIPLTELCFALAFCAGHGRLAAQGTAFTYQGSLQVNNQTANGSYDLSFTLFNVASGGSPVTTTLTSNAVPVVNGLFTTTLDFGSGPFLGGAQLWLEIRVNGKTLAPRQPLSPAPYALFAPYAGVAAPNGPAGGDLTGAFPNPTLSNNPALLARVSGGALTASGGDVTIPAGNLGIGVTPSGARLDIAGGDLRLRTTNFGITFADGSRQLSAATAPLKPANIKWVALSGGDFTTIQAAIDSISDASASNPYLIRVGPGVYSGAITLQQWVSVEGSGEGTTRIHGAIGGGAAVVSQPDNTELRNLTVELTNSDFSVGYAIHVTSGSPRIRNVTVTGTGTTMELVYADGASPVLTHTTITLSGTGGFATGFHSFAGGPVTLTDCTISVSGADTSVARGAFAYGGGTLVLKNCVISSNGYSIASQNAAVLKAVQCQLTGTIDVSAGGFLTKLQCYDANLNPL